MTGTMQSLARFFHESPVAAGAVFFVVVALFLGGLLAAMMRHASVSRRPLVFFFGFLAIVGAPQGALHLLDAALSATTGTASTGGSTSAPSSTAVAATLHPVPWELVFGPNAEADLITDARPALGEILATAIEARLSFRADGSTALAARFTDAAAAMAAMNAYGSFFRFAQATGSDALGWTARRFDGQGEWNHVAVAGSELYAWSGATSAQVIAERERLFGPINDVGGVAGPAVSTRAAADWLQQRPGLLGAFVAVNLLLAVGWFFKGSAWATRVTPSPGRGAADVAVLRQRLLALKTAAGPIDVTETPAGDLQIDWRYGDARWFDLMRVQAMRRAHRLVLRLDADDRTVRVREYWSAFDAAAGMGGARLEWRAARGIQFFQIEHQRVFGVQLDEHGRPTGELTKAWTFDLQAMKLPLIEAVTAAGWTWQPVLLLAPPGLRWLLQ